ncbi:cell cycle checkpoint [Stereum hirsutum FP-91666 SS1]|uniref:cell cycle checkpoint n=1 Tax=Stereum hirsutum (strain FP-91666) TaxID=721885 RepID=UPI000440C854|nr:cell cycle checkpoint [Stereum hirsutum FP-91666 SS1]EIM90672.1 cell cycle checkpoint [Stereum hirsutum FP-91666 SS1]
MRFRASIQNVDTFHRIIQTVEKLQKKCIVKFTESEMHIICNTDESGVQVWSQIRVISLFADYRIQSNANNEISLALSTTALSAALRSATSNSSSNPSGTSAEEVIMKLAKKRDAAVLSFEIFGASRMGRRVKVEHDVRIEVLKPAEVARLSEPLCPEPDIHILLPPLLKIRTIVERLRPLADVIAVRANKSGKLQISAATESAKMDVVWEGCANPKMAQPNPSQSQANTDPDNEDDEAETDPTKLFGVLVHVRSFLKFLNSHVVSTTTIACICQHHCMILYVYIGEVADAGGVLTFYIPAVQED